MPCGRKGSARQVDLAVEIVGVAYAPGPDRGNLAARSHVPDTAATYRLVFPTIAAMRLRDKGGPSEFRRQTVGPGGRPGRTTFRVGNHAWTRDSVPAFLETDGWSWAIASGDICLEVVSAAAPTITEDRARDRRGSP